MKLENNDLLEMQEWYLILPEIWKKIFEINLFLNNSGILPNFPYGSLENLIKLERVEYDCSKKPSPSITEPDLRKLLSLKYIYCNGEPIGDINPLAYLTRLRHVSFFKCKKITTLYPIAHIKSIESIDFSYTAVESLVDLENLPILKKISCWKAPIEKEKISAFLSRHENCTMEVEQN